MLQVCHHEVGKFVFVAFNERCIQGRNEGGARGAPFPGRRITIGAPNDCQGRQKVLTMS